MGGAVGTVKSAIYMRRAHGTYWSEHADRRVGAPSTLIALPSGPPDRPSAERHGCCRSSSGKDNIPDVDVSERSRVCAAAEKAKNYLGGDVIGLLVEGFEDEAMSFDHWFTRQFKQLIQDGTRSFLLRTQPLTCEHF